ncbi:hypothetical protein NPIL_344871 [Nephila pilipes]|uniref:Secreted protein n=1 Tax=Nephila pilipes TaxID=299642 RepID=A0A8X6P0P5_NEPPI|nr:hypothetical protein NPIL_344871 [Nephila pilipes]
MHRSICTRSLDIFRELCNSLLLSCCFPLVEAGNTKVAFLSATRSLTGKPLSAKITSPGLTFSKNPLSWIICLSEVLPPNRCDTNVTHPDGEHARRNFTVLWFL